MSMYLVEIIIKNKYSVDLFVYSPGPSLNEKTMFSKLIDIAKWFPLTPYPLQEKNEFVSSNGPRSLSYFSAVERKPLPILDVASCAYDTLIGPELPWVELVETC